MVNRGGLCAGTQTESSDVLLAVSVAVAERYHPSGTVAARVLTKVARPLGSVVTLVEPR